MSGIKCPICNKPLKEQTDGTCISYQETACICNVAAPKLIWKEMAALRKKHNIFTKSVCIEKEFAEEECKRLKIELDRTRKALGIAVDALDRMAVHDSIYDIIARNAMKRIKELEQKGE